MALKNYGVLKGKAFDRQKATSQSEHYQILINRDTEPHRISINTKSNLAPSQVMYYADDNYHHEITDKLMEANLPNGFKEIPSKPGGLALDFIRRNLFPVDELMALPSNAPGADNDLNDKLDFFVQQAIDDPTATIYAFGEHWGPEANKPDKYFGFNPGNGIHDIHMNQGNPPGRYAKDNGPWQDGGLLFHFASRNRWAAVFTKFQSQAIHADDSTGEPLITLPADDVNQPENKTPIRIIAAMINPASADPGKEFVILLNKSNAPVNLDGWQILDRNKKGDTITNTMIDASSTLKVTLTGQGAQLGNNGGIITILNKEGLKVDGAVYTKNDADKEDELVEL